MFIVELFTIAKLWNQPVDTSGHMDKINLVIYAMQYNPTISMKEIMSLTCMKLHVGLSREQKDTY